MRPKLDRMMSLRYNPMSDTVVGFYGCLADHQAPFRGISLDDDITLEVIRVGNRDLISGFQIISIGAHPEWSLLFSEWFLDATMSVLVDTVHRLQRESEDLEMPQRILGLREMVQTFEEPPMFEHRGSHGAPV